MRLIHGQGLPVWDFRGLWVLVFQRDVLSLLFWVFWRLVSGGLNKGWRYTTLCMVTDTTRRNFCSEKVGDQWLETSLNQNITWYLEISLWLDPRQKHRHCYQSKLTVRCCIPRNHWGWKTTPFPRDPTNVLPSDLFSRRCLIPGAQRIAKRNVPSEDIPEYSHTHQCGDQWYMDWSTLLCNRKDCRAKWNVHDFTQIAVLGSVRGSLGIESHILVNLWHSSPQISFSCQRFCWTYIECQRRCRRLGNHYILQN